MIKIKMRLRKQPNIKYKIKLNYKMVLFKFIQTKKKKVFEIQLQTKKVQKKFKHKDRLKLHNNPICECTTFEGSLISTVSSITNPSKIITPVTTSPDFKLLV